MYGHNNTAEKHDDRQVQNSHFKPSDLPSTHKTTLLAVSLNNTIKINKSKINKTL